MTNTNIMQALSIPTLLENRIKYILHYNLNKSHPTVKELAYSRLRPNNKMRTSPLRCVMQRNGETYIEWNPKMVNYLKNTKELDSFLVSFIHRITIECENKGLIRR